MCHVTSFRRIERARNDRGTEANPDPGGLCALLTRHVIEPFERLCVLRDAVVGLGSMAAGRFPDLGTIAVHPICASHAGSNRCRRCRELHLAEIGRGSEAHWHVCDYAVYCAIAPVVHCGACLAIVRLTCPSDQSHRALEHHVKLLDLLIEHFVIPQADFLDRLVCGRTLPPQSPVAADAPHPSISPRPYHPRIAQAIEYVEDHLPEPDLSVAGVARALSLNPNYLSGLFVDRLGQRLGRFILERRMDRAKVLLTRTDGMIKEIARAVGFAHPNWFCHLFARCTGLTPQGYRHQARRAGHAD